MTGVLDRFFIKGVELSSEMTAWKDLRKRQLSTYDHKIQSRNMKLKGFKLYFILNNVQQENRSIPWKCEACGTIRKIIVLPFI